MKSSEVGHKQVNNASEKISKNKHKEQENQRYGFFELLKRNTLNALENTFKSSTNTPTNTALNNNANLNNSENSLLNNTEKQKYVIDFNYLDKVTSSSLVRL